MPNGERQPVSAIDAQQILEAGAGIEVTVPGVQVIATGEVGGQITGEPPVVLKREKELKLRYQERVEDAEDSRREAERALAALTVTPQAGVVRMESPAQTRQREQAEKALGQAKTVEARLKLTKELVDAGVADAEDWSMPFVWQEADVDSVTVDRRSYRKKVGEERPLKVIQNAESLGRRIGGYIEAVRKAFDSVPIDRKEAYEGLNKNRAEGALNSLPVGSSAKEFLGWLVKNYSGEVDEKGEVTQAGILQYARELRRYLRGESELGRKSGAEKRGFEKRLGERKTRLLEMARAVSTETEIAADAVRERITNYVNQAVTDPENAFSSLEQAWQDERLRPLLLLVDREITDRKGLRAWQERTLRTLEPFLKRLELGLWDSKLVTLLGADLNNPAIPGDVRRLKQAERGLMQRLLGEEVIGKPITFGRAEVGPGAAGVEPVTVQVQVPVTEVLTTARETGLPTGRGRGVQEVLAALDQI